MHDVLIVLAVIAVVAFVIVRQLKGEPIRGKRLIVLPAVLALIGIVDLTNAGRHPAAIDIFFISVSALIAAGIGVGQGLMMHLEPRLGALWGQDAGQEPVAVGRADCHPRRPGRDRLGRTRPRGRVHRVDPAGAGS